MDSPGAKCCCCCLCLLIVIIIVLIAMSISSLPINTYGLDYNGISKTISTDVKTSGIHMLGPLHSFLKYPKTMQTFEFAKTRNS